MAVFWLGKIETVWQSTPLQCKILGPQTQFYAPHSFNARFRATTRYNRYAARNLTIPRQRTQEGYGGAP